MNIDKKVIRIITILAILEYIPIFSATILGINYGASDLGIFHQYLNEKLYLAYISWLSFDVLGIYFIYNIIKSNYETPTKMSIILCILMFSYLSVYPLLQIGNLLFSLIFNNKPFIENHYKHFPESLKLEKNYEKIKNEYLLHDSQPICVHKSVKGFQISTGTDDKCWRTIILKKQGKLTDIASKNYPFLSTLLLNKNIHNAMFSILDGNVNIPPHTGYYKGYLRYHLGIIIPQENDKKPYIICGGKKYYWKNGEGVLFDDMYLHYVNNPTSSKRVVLYIDVLRNNIPIYIKPIYNFFNLYIENHIVLKKIVQVQHEQKNN